MRNVTGAVAQGSDFFNRANEMATFWRDLETDNILLLAPRRVGKTSVMRKMEEDAGDHGMNPVFVDVSDCADELRFVERLYAAVLANNSGDLLWNHIKESWLGKAIQRVQKAGGAGFSVEFRPVEAAWSRLGEELTGALCRLEGRWLIQIDELPVFLLKLLNHDEPAARDRVREFLYWLRRLRLEFGEVRWFLAGSIGLDTITTRLNMADSINDLRIQTLGAFDGPTADALLAALAAEYRIALSDVVRGHVVNKVGWPAPYYLQLVFHELRNKRGAITPADVDRAIEDLLGPQHRNYFDYWRQRLFEELGRPDAEYAIDMLNAACHALDGVTRAILGQALASAISDPGIRGDKLRYLLDVLQNDGYLVEGNRRWRFRSPLLREYWLRRVAPDGGHA
jgi:uncharacterized protein